MGWHQQGKNHVFIFRCVEGGIEIERFGGAWRHHLVSGGDFDDFLECRQDEPNCIIWFEWFSDPHFLAVHYLLLVLRVFTTHKTLKTGKFIRKWNFFQAMFSWNDIISNKVGFFSSTIYPSRFQHGTNDQSQGVNEHPQSQMVLLQGWISQRLYIDGRISYVHVHRKIVTP